MEIFIGTKKLTRKESYELICNDYVKEFAKKQKIEFEYWVGDDIGDRAFFNCSELSFSFDEIRHDIDTNQPKGLIIDWYYGCVENEKNMNYQSYCMGLRFDKL